MKMKKSIRAEQSRAELLNAYTDRISITCRPPSSSSWTAWHEESKSKKRVAPDVMWLTTARGRCGKGKARLRQLTPS